MHGRTWCAAITSWWSIRVLSCKQETTFQFTINSTISTFLHTPQRHVIYISSVSACLLLLFVFIGFNRRVVCVVLLITFSCLLSLSTIWVLLSVALYLYDHSINVIFLGYHFSWFSIFQLNRKSDVPQSTTYALGEI